MDMILVTLCCATQVRLRCSTNPPQANIALCSFCCRTLWTNPDYTNPLLHFASFNAQLYGSNRVQQM